MDSKKLTLVLAVLLVALIMPAAAMAAPAVSVECAYSDTKLDCEVYVNTDSDQLRSGGVRLGYNADELINPVATKNADVWTFGPGNVYMNPETGTSGEVVFIVGMLDIGNTGAGVNGTRVLVGKASFTRVTNTLPVADPATTFGITAGLGRVAPYVNFVNVGGDNLDIAPVGFNTPIVVERGDTDGNGLLDPRDLNSLIPIIRAGGLSEDYPIYVNCDGNDVLDTRDINCLIGKLRR